MSSSVRLGGCLALVALSACGSKSNCPGNSSDPCQQLSNAFSCLDAEFTDCTTTNTFDVATCDQEIAPCSSADDTQIDQFATCVSNIPGGNCSQNPDLIQSQSLAEEDCFGQINLSSACESSTGLTFVAWGTETTDGVCPSTPQTLTGTGQPGASCTEADQCAPACCTCSNGDTGQFLGAACKNEACASDICTVVNAELPGSADNPCP